jgi:hypothetical protein
LPSSETPTAHLDRRGETGGVWEPWDHSAAGPSGGRRLMRRRPRRASRAWEARLGTLEGQVRLGDVVHRCRSSDATDVAARSQSATALAGRRLVGSGARRLAVWKSTRAAGGVAWTEPAVGRGGGRRRTGNDRRRGRLRYTSPRDGRKGRLSFPRIFMICATGPCFAARGFEGPSAMRLKDSRSCRPHCTRRDPPIGPSHGQGGGDALGPDSRGRGRSRRKNVPDGGTMPYNRGLTDRNRGPSSRTDLVACLRGGGDRPVCNLLGGGKTP